MISEDEIKLFVRAIKDVAKVAGIAPRSVFSRLERGWSLEDAKRQRRQRRCDDEIVAIASQLGIKREKASLYKVVKACSSLTYEAVSARLASGMTLSDALYLPRFHHKNAAKPGSTRALAEAAGIPLAKVRWRLRHGFTLEQALCPGRLPSRQRRATTRKYGPVNGSIASKARDAGINLSTFYRRIRQGETIKQALSTDRRVRIGSPRTNGGPR